MNGYDPGLALGGNGDPNAPLKPIDLSNVQGYVVDLDVKLQYPLPKLTTNAIN